jgi:hypothetical protein
MKNGQIKWQRSKNTVFESLDYKDHAVVDGPNIKWPSYHMPIAFGFTNNRKFSIINMLSIYQLSYSTLNLVSVVDETANTQSIYT